MKTTQISKTFAKDKDKYDYYKGLAALESSKFFYIEPHLLDKNELEDIKNTVQSASSGIKQENNEKQQKPKPTGCNLDDENGPGSFIHNIIKNLTGESFSPTCGCCSKIKKINKDGWVQALKNAKEIKSFMLLEAKKRGLTADLEDSWSNFLITGGKMIAKNIVKKCCGGNCKK